MMFHDLPSRIAPPPRAPAQLSGGLAERIVAHVGRFFGIAEHDITGPRRLSSIARARFIAMHLMDELTEFSLSEIGRRFGGRDHTTVMNALRVANARINTDPLVAEQVRQLRLEVAE